MSLSPANFINPGPQITLTRWAWVPAFQVCFYTSRQREFLRNETNCFHLKWRTSPTQMWWRDLVSSNGAAVDLDWGLQSHRRELMAQLLLDFNGSWAPTQLLWKPQASVTCICCFPFATRLFLPMRMVHMVVEEESKSAQIYHFLSCKL